jgi:RHS repeat-associated protein
MRRRGSGPLFGPTSFIRVCCLTVCLLPAARAGTGEQYIESYNRIVLNLNDRLVAVGQATNSLKSVERGDSLGQQDLDQLRKKVRDLLQIYVVAPDGFVLGTNDETQAFPAGLRYKNGLLVQPSLMDGIGTNGLFTKIPEECVANGVTICAESFIDVPVLWVHLEELHRAIGRMQYSRAAGTWTANGEMNKRSAQGWENSWAAAMQTAQTGYDAGEGYTEEAAPHVCAYGDRYRSSGRVYVADVTRRCACLRVSGLAAGFPHALSFYLRGDALQADPYYFTLIAFDANGDGVQQGAWSKWDETSSSTEATITSARFGSLSVPTWCVEPPKGQVSVRGYAVGAQTAVIRWQFESRPISDPVTEDPEEDGLCTLGCDCVDCVPEADANWRGMKEQTGVRFPIGISSGIGHAGVRVKAYVTEYEIAGITRQMFSLDTRVLGVFENVAEGWHLLSVKRPSGVEVVFSLQGEKAARAINVSRDYRIARDGSAYEIHFAGPQKVVHRFGAGAGITEVRMTPVHAEVKVSGSSAEWPQMKAFREPDGSIRSNVCPTTIAVPTYASGLMRSVSYRNRQGATLSRIEYAPGSKRFTARDSNDAPMSEVRILGDAAGRASEVWRGVTTNAGLYVARKELRTAVADPDGIRTTIREVAIENPDTPNADSNVTVTVLERFRWGEEIISRTVDAAGPDPRISRFGYYTNRVEDGPNYGRLKRLEDPDGSWTEHEYDGTGRETALFTSFKNAVPGDTNACRRTRSFYAGDPLLAALGFPSNEIAVTNDTRPRLVIEELLGHEISRTWHAILPDRSVTRRCRTRGARFDASDNLPTTTFCYTNGLFKGRPRRTEHANGTFSIWAYATDAATNSLTTTNDTGAGAGDVVTNGTRTVTILDGGQRVLRETRSDIASGVLISDVLHTRDEFGRDLCVSNLVNGERAEYRYGCCGPETVRDAEGVVTTNVYDELKRPFAVTRLGVTRFTSYDVDGNVTETRQTAAGEADIVTALAYDKAGRLRQESNELGRVTRYDYGTNAAGERVVTTTFADGSTSVETSYRDGRLKSLSGTAVHPVCYDSGADETGCFNVVYYGPDTNAAEWVKSYVNLLGDPCLTVYPDGYCRTNRYDDQGRPAGNSDGITTRLTQYNDSGEPFRTAVDMDGSGAIDVAGSDRITETESSFGAVDGAPVRMARRRVYPEVGSEATVPVSEQRTAMDGSAVWSIAYGRTNHTQIVRDRDRAARVETLTRPDGTQVISSYTNNLLMTVCRLSAAGVTVSARTFAYDAFGRLESERDIAPDGTERLVTREFDAAGQVTNRTVAAGGLARTTGYEYDIMGRLVRMLLPGGAAITNEYAPSGELMRTRGGRTLPVAWTHDDRGRISTVSTWRNGESGAADTTQWLYDSRRGWNTAKVFADGATNAFEYNPDGTLRKRTWGRGVATEHRYNAASELSEVSYSDGTPAVGYVRDRLGRVVVVTDATGVRTNAYATDGQMLRESFPDAGASVEWSYDANGRRAQMDVVRAEAEPSKPATPPGLDDPEPTGSGYPVSYSYDSAGRLSGISDGSNSAAYSYAADGEAVAAVVLAGGTDAVVTGNRTYDSLGRLTSFAWTAEGMAPISFSYEYNDADQKTRAVLADGTYWIYEYDAAGQLVSARKYSADGQPVSGAQFEYEYDTAGNRVTSTGTDGPGTTNGYTANALNQYTGLTAQEAVQKAAPPGTIFTFGSGAAPFGGFAGPAKAAAAATVSRTLTYDADGNLLSDGVRTYTWDAENRLTSITPTLPNTDTPRLCFTYDHLGRRTRRQVYAWSADQFGAPELGGGGWSLLTDTRFVYDGWRLVFESEICHSESEIRTNLSWFVWGLDLSGSLWGAGGIGGLLWSSSLSFIPHPSSFFLYDGLGNVSALVQCSESSQPKTQNTELRTSSPETHPSSFIFHPSLQASCEYGPFGEVVSEISNPSISNPFRFSTKYSDSLSLPSSPLPLSSSLSWFGRRYYSPTLGRFLSRDPIEEAGGVNLYAFVRNAPPNAVDALGLALYAFDGTANVPDDETNVYLTYRSGWGTPNAHYEKGIGNQEEYSVLTALPRQATGWGLSAKRSSMLAAMERFLYGGDTDVDVIGFSRGAVTAITFAEAVQKLKKERVYPYCLVERIRFMGLYDPVPGPFIRHRPAIPGIVQRTAIAYSLDEKRYQFTPSVYASGGGVIAAACRGGHSDVGGGYPERGLANISLEWMIEQGQAAGAPFKYPSVSGGPKMLRHQDINYNLFLYTDRTGLGGIPAHPSASRLVAGPVDEVIRAPRQGVDVTPYTYYLDSIAPGNDEYRVGDRRF